MLVSYITLSTEAKTKYQISPLAPFHPHFKEKLKFNKEEKTIIAFTPCRWMSCTFIDEPAKGKTNTYSWSNRYGQKVVSVHYAGIYQSVYRIYTVFM